MSDSHWDVFLSYASPDRVDVEKLALRLEAEANLRVFLDKWRLIPGQNFISELEDAIRASKSCAVFLGKGNVRPWQHQEVQAVLNRAVRRSEQSGLLSPFPVIPVLLPGAIDLTDDEIPSFIGLRTWVDFRSPQGIEDDTAFASLVAGIRGVAPGKPSVVPSWLTTSIVGEVRRPTGIAVDGEAMFLADHEAGTVTRVERSTSIKRATGLLKPHHLIVMGDTVVVADTHHNQLVTYDLDLVVRQKTTVLGEYHLRRPHGLASNYPGEFYVTDADNHRVLRVQDGEVTAAAGKPGNRAGFEIGEFSVPCGVAAALDCVYVADTYNHRIQVLTRDLRALSSFGGLGHGVSQFAYPVSVAAWHEWILVGDEHNKRLQLWRRDAPGVPFGATCLVSDLCRGLLGSPFGLSFDVDGQLFVADRKEGKVVRIAFDRMLAALEVPRTSTDIHG